MKRFPSVKKNGEFQKIYRGGTSHANRLLVMYVMKNGEESNRIGISVSKKVGNSVVRHHITRLLREIFRLNEDRIQTGLNIVVVASELIMVAKLLIFLVRVYQKYLSPLKIRTHCIYTPTCSQYAVEALQKYGALKGTWLACKRILRCHPFAEGGYDPVP